MLPGKTGRRNAGPRRANLTPIGTRNIRPRKPVVLPPYDDETGGDFYECEVEEPTRAAMPTADDDDEDPDELTADLARARDKREQAGRVEVETRAKSAPAADRTGEGVADDEGEEG